MIENTKDIKYLCDIATEIRDTMVIWYQWEALFDHDADRLRTLNNTGNLFFGSIERVFYRDVVLGICRLTDPEKQNGHQNITIKHFQSGDYREDAVLQKLIKDVSDTAKPLRVWRRKRLAHLDAKTSIGWHPPSGCERDAVSRALQGLAAVLRHVWIKAKNEDILLGDRNADNCLLRAQISPHINKTLNALSSIKGFK